MGEYPPGAPYSDEEAPAGAIAAADSEVEEDETPEIAQQRAEVEQTRAAVTDTIEAIREKLSPHHLVEHAKETVREATVGRAQEAVSNVVDTAKQAASNVADTAKQAASNVGQAVTNVGESVRGTGSDIMD